MASRNPNAVAGVMVALYCGLVIACLVLVLAVPGELRFSRSIGFGVCAAAVLGIPVLLRVAERSRIRQAVHESGCTILKLRRLPFWRQGWDYYSSRAIAPKYEVEFSD